jgi:hypothetical protein
MITVEDIKAELIRIKDKPKFEKMLDFASILTEYFAAMQIKPIIVGGLSVEIYTRNDYMTHDIDFVTTGWHEFDKLLRELGFTKTHREWYHTDSEIAVEVPASFLEGSYDKVIELQLPNGRRLYVIGIEDIIIHRLEGIFLPVPEDDEDYEWAMRMFLIHKDEIIDMDYLIEQAKKTNTYRFVEKWMTLEDRD